MSRTARFSHLILPGLVLGAILVNSSTTNAQIPEAQSNDRAELEQLRRRIVELEAQNLAIQAQNTAIQEQLAAIQSRLERLDRNPTVTNAVQVASTVPIVPPAATAAPVSRPVIPPPTQAQPTVLEAETNRSALTFYGHARLDAAFDDSRINNFQAPTLVRPEPPDADNQANFTLHPRMTRFGVNYRAPGTLDAVGGATVNGKFEIDFLNGGSDSRGIPRYRHVFLQLNWQRHSLLAGQTSDIISPIFPNVNSQTLMWNAGNPGDRRTQLRYSYGTSTSPGFNLQTGLVLTGALNGQDADGDGIRDGEASAMPGLQGRVGYNTPNGRAFVGLWSHYAREHTSTAFARKNDFESYSFGGDFDFRLTPQVSLRGELWKGSNMGDVRGGAGQSFNRLTGKEIDSRGGWIEMGLRGGNVGFFTGYTVDDPNNGHVPSGGISLNRAGYFHTQFRLGPPVTTGFEYIRWQTKYKMANEGTDNRLNIYIQYTY